MDFGKVSVKELNEIDFTLPDDHTDTEKLFASLKGKKKKQKVYVGCAKWGRKEWLGKIYPPKTKEKDFVTYYVKQFNSIELNATHYRIPSPDSIKKWKSDAGKDFKFCPKFPQWISHIRRLKNCERENDQFYGAIDGFGENLGTCFLQMAPNFTPKNHNDLEAYVKSLPKIVDVCVEFRQPEWFKDTEIANDTFVMLRENGLGSVITDTAGRRDCAHMRLTSPTAFIRFVGNSLHPSDFKRVDDWVERLKKWLGSGLETLYFMMHMHDEKDSPELAAYTIRQLNKKCGLDLKEPLFYNSPQN
ncbi:MAG: DUF72 domain-containing protein [Chlorobi bacterium]|nr:DUF72 domain-containing protein [Chlorobiota bacterium]MCI0716093.1 DUF72 domain-containing protein [Chlorobiota bacterium]